MPVYEYECNGCEKKLEVIQKFNDPPLANCPECGGELRKLVSNTSFVLKGAGWYISDYPSSDRKKAMEKEKKVTSPSDKSEKGSSSKDGSTVNKKEQKKETVATE